MDFEKSQKRRERSENGTAGKRRPSVETGPGFLGGLCCLCGHRCFLGIYYLKIYKIKPGLPSDNLMSMENPGFIYFEIFIGIVVLFFVLMFQSRSKESFKKRMRFVRSGFELRMSLRSNEPRMFRNLDHLHNTAIRRKTG